MKFFIGAFIFSLSFGAFAISDSKLIEKCTPAAKEEIYRLANLRRCTIVNDQITLADIDNRMMNPSKYLRFVYQAKCEGHEELQTGTFIAQYFMGKCYVSN